MIDIIKCIVSKVSLVNCYIVSLYIVADSDYFIGLVEMSANYV